MDWTAPVDSYCERLDASFWAEPVNAVTNAAFLVAALIMALRLRGARLPVAWALVWIVAAIGLGSLLFHTFAQPWAGVADSVPILVFILLYLYAATRDFLGLSWQISALVTVGYFPFAAVTVPLFGLIPGLGGSAVYATVPTLMVIYAVLLWRRAPATARGLILAAVMLTTSIIFRALDEPLCGVFPLGTHFMWHLLNGVMLGWMIEVYRRHMAGPASPSLAPA